MTPSKKICNTCKVVKRLSEFYKANQCKECRTAYQNKWRKANPDKVKAMWQRYQKTEKGREYQKRARERHKLYNRVYARKWHQRHRERDLKWQLKWKLRRHGVDMAWYESQPQRCAICGKENGRRFNIDHDPKTGKARGLLCDLCNTGLGWWKDDVALFRKAAAYLERHGK